MPGSLLELQLFKQIFDGQKIHSDQPESFRTLECCFGPARHAGFLSRRGIGHEYHCYPEPQQCFYSDATSHPAAPLGITFLSGTLETITTKDQYYNLVIFAYNAFGQSEITQRESILREAFRVMKPGGFLLIELPRPEMRGWEWVTKIVSDGKRPSSAVHELGHILASYEQTANGDKIRRRHINVDLQRGVVADTAYEVTPYTSDEIRQLLNHSGFSQPPMNTASMEQQGIVILQKPGY
jgi:ubiquinone/menaquinone biosynthesis C-methylase UbiE